MATVAVLKETVAGERRVALVPESVGRLTRGGTDVRVQAGAGDGALIADSAYADAGATIVSDTGALLGGADVVVGVRRPDPTIAAALPAGVILTGGGVQLPGAVELAREVFAAPARVGTPDRGVSGLADSVQAPRYAVPVGLLLYAARQKAGVDGGGGDAAVERWLAPVKRWFQDFF